MAVMELASFGYLKKKKETSPSVWNISMHNRKRISSIDFKWDLKMLHILTPKFQDLA